MIRVPAGFGGEDRIKRYLDYYQPSYGVMMLSAGQFSPASLFAAGEQGVWYDPSDFTTMFQDSAGTTPVTAVEQPVGLLLDKSKGLVLGAEIFSSFTSTGLWTVSGSTYSISSAASSTDLRVDFIGTVGKRYVISFTASGVSGSVIFYPLNTSPPSIVNGTNVTRELSNAGFFIIRATTGASATVSNISVKELPGNHASQSTSASRPVLSARYNLLTYTEQFDNAAWSKDSLLAFGSGSTINATTAPNGTVTADLITAANATAAAGVGQSAAVIAAAHTWSICFKPNGVRYVQLLWSTTASTNYANYDIVSGIVTAGTYTAATITQEANGFYRLSITSTINAGNFGAFAWFVDSGTAARTASFTGDGVKGAYIWGADLRVTNDGVGLPAYQRVGAATYGVTNPSVVIGNPDYDTTGFPLYLKFDGTDDGLSTASIDFTSTDEMSVFGGLRKLSDVNVAVVAELGVIYFAVNGSFVVAAPGSVAPTGYEAAAKGTVNSGIGASDPAPTTDVLTAPIKISTDQLVLRNNGVQVAQSTLDLGGGNFGNHPLYIGRRGDTTLPYNGRIYSLIVRGAQSTATEITNTETWVNSKTGAF
jgi:hypothetical protein